MGIDDFVEDPEEFSGNLEVGEIPSLRANSPPGKHIRWKKYEPYTYDQFQFPSTIGIIGDCDIEGSQNDKMMVVGPPNADKEELIKSDVYVDL